MKESKNYVECACSHLSIYAAYAEFATLASYNEAFYASGIICISGIRHVASAFAGFTEICYTDTTLPTSAFSFLLSLEL